MDGARQVPRRVLGTLADIEDRAGDSGGGHQWDPDHRQPGGLPRVDASGQLAGEGPVADLESLPNDVGAILVLVE